MVILALRDQEYGPAALDWAATGEQNFTLTEDLTKETLQTETRVNTGGMNKANQGQKAGVMSHGKPTAELQHK